MRARIRKTLLPLLEEKFQPATVPHLATLAKLAAENESFLDALTRRCTTFVKRTDDTLAITLDDLLGPWPQIVNSDLQHPAIGNVFATASLATLQKRLLRYIVAEVKQQDGQLTSQHIQALLQFAQHGENGKVLSLPGGVEVRRTSGALIFLSKCNRQGASAKAEGKFEPANYRYLVHPSHAEVQVPELGCGFCFTLIDWPGKRGETSNRGAVLDRDRLSFPLVLRNWLPGDRFHPVGHRNARKLKRLLNEKRISRWERDGWPVLTSSGVLVWSRGFPVAAGFAAHERTRVGMVIVERKLP
ncbi:MAG: hypothetical protein NVS9B4_14010 [Candidatus Acidiferrum sp.]